MFKDLKIMVYYLLNTFLTKIDKEEKDFVVKSNILNACFHRFD